MVLLQGLLLLQAQLERVGCLVLKFTDALLVLGNTLAQQPHLFGLAVELRAQPPALVALRVQGRLQHLALQLDLGVAVTHPREVLPHALNLVLVHPDLGVGALELGLALRGRGLHRVHPLRGLHDLRPELLQLHIPKLHVLPALVHLPLRLLDPGLQVARALAELPLGVGVPDLEVLDLQGALLQQLLQLQPVDLRHLQPLLEVLEVELGLLDVPLQQALELAQGPEVDALVICGNAAAAVRHAHHLAEPVHLEALELGPPVVQLRLQAAQELVDLRVNVKDLPGEELPSGHGGPCGRVDL